MKKSILLLASIGALAFASCKKANTDDILASTPSYQKADETSARAEIDKSLDDIDKVMNQTGISGGRTEGINLPCGIVKFDSVTTNGVKTYTLTYGGKNCGVKYLSGDISYKLQKGTKFSEKDALLEVTYTNYKVEYQSNKQTIIFNGTHYITNLTGGTIKNLKTLGTISHKIRGKMQLTFNNSIDTIRAWTITRKKTLSCDKINESSISFKIEGDTSFDSGGKTYNNVCEWGQNKEKKDFINQLDNAFIWKNAGVTWAGPYILSEGNATHTTTKKSGTKDINVVFKVKAGYKLNGIKPEYVGNTSAEGYSLEWTLGDPINLSSSSYQPY